MAALVLLLRLVAATAGAYGLAVAWVAAFSLAWPGPRADAVLLGTASSFLVATLAVIWIFATASLGRALAGMAVAAAILVAIAWLAGPR
ncbi:hypothetical protein EDC65_0665 [Stella humosa]|uniref:Iron uptake protein n=1 Tax=Stella humosa TaxID=94 RepID=A0A3N1MKI2_9PROT|nr:hypothetical protein [Stella humosa]ROQ01486.1 hypothetical protein EDC65_0665 [Stella humosa]BBK31864.1 hypothetical protein STHU_24980 [Stella humosa]